MNYLEVLKIGEEKLKVAKENVDVAKLLMLHFSKLTPTDLYASLNQEIDFDYTTYINSIHEYIMGKPLQHIRGYEYFFGHKFITNNEVFIPRPETELLCEIVIREAESYLKNSKNICDIGTGSGAIAITLANEFKNSNTYATEISRKAIEIAKINAINNKAKVKFLQGSFLEPLVKLEKKFDLIVSNPPYIALDGKLDSRVKGHDPDIALFGGEDGLDPYREILSDILKITSEKWILAFEFGSDQKLSLEKIINNLLPSKKFKFYKDYSNLWRIVLIWG